MHGHRRPSVPTSLAPETDMAALSISAPSAKLQNSAHNSTRQTREHQEPLLGPHPFASQGRSSHYPDAPISRAEYFGRAEFASPNAEVDQDDAFGNEDDFGRTISREAAADSRPGKMALGRKSASLRQSEITAEGLSSSIPPSPGPPPAQLPPLPTSPSAAPYQQPTSRSRSTTANSSTSLTSPTRRKPRIPSREILQSALDLAQRAVTADGTNDIPSALAMYRDAVGKLRSVMGRVGMELEPLDRGLGVPEPGEEEKAEIREAAGRRRRGSGRGAQEGNTLKGIHDAYVARIILLCEMAGGTALISHSPASGAGLVPNPPISDSITNHSQTTSNHGSGATGLGLGMPNGFANHAGEGTSPSLEQNGGVQAPTLPSSASQTSFPETRPVISPRIASLTAYQTLPLPFAPPAQPSSSNLDEASTKPRQSVPVGHDRDFSYELVDKPDLHPQQIDAVPSKSQPSLNRSNSSAPSRPSRNPLRAAAPQSGEGRISISDRTRAADDPEQTQMNRHPSSRTLVSSENMVSTVVSSEGERTSRDTGEAARNPKLERIRSNQSGKTIRLAPLSTSPDTNVPPSNAVTMPFYVLRQIRDSMTSTQGAFVSQGLFVPSATWAQVGVKIPAVETKIRIMELLSEGLQVVRKAGSVSDVDMSTGSLHLTVSELSQSAGLKALNAALDDFEALTVEIQKILVKKLGNGKSLAKPRKSNTNSISNWSSKFSKTLDKMTTGKSLESTSTYNDSLIRLCNDAQAIESCITSMTADPSRIQPYPDARSTLESKLYRISEFFADVLLRFVLQDLSVLLSKYLEQSSLSLQE